MNTKASCPAGGSRRQVHAGSQGPHAAPGGLHLRAPWGSATRRSPWRLAGGETEAWAGKLRLGRGPRARPPPPGLGLTGMTAKVFNTWFRLRTSAHLPGCLALSSAEVEGSSRAAGSAESAGWVGGSMVQRVWRRLRRRHGWGSLIHLIRCAPPSGNPKPGHLPRAHGNGGLGDARGRERGGGARAAAAPSHLSGTPNILTSWGIPRWLHRGPQQMATEPQASA